MAAISRYFTRDFLSTLAVNTAVDSVVVIALLLRFSVVILSMTDRHRRDL
jgi:hypothetical protein